MKGALYCRVSTDLQNYHRQTYELTQYAKQNNIEIVRVFEETESGFFNDRPQFNELCKLTKEDIDIVIVYELSRLSRRAVFLQKKIEDFTNKGINIYARKENRYTLGPDGKPDPTTQIIIAFISTFAQQEAASFKARWRSARDYNIIHQSYSNRLKPMYGYIYNKKTKKVEIDKEHSEMIKMIFDLTIKGYSAKRICTMLTASGFSTMYGKEWNPGTISCILKNEFYTGSFHYKDKVLSSPQIITKETFKKARRAVIQRSVPKVHSIVYNFLLKGIVKCPYCGRPYTTNTARGYYFCSSQKHRIITKCNGININSDCLDSIVWEIIQHTYIYQNEICINALIDKRQIEKLQDNVNKLNEKKQKIERKRKKSIDQALAFSYKTPNKQNKIASVMDKIYKQSESLNECNIDIDENKSKIIEYEQKYIQTFISKVPNAGEMSAIINELISKIVPFRYSRNSVIIVFLKTGEKFFIVYNSNKMKERYVWFEEQIIKYNFPYENKGVADFSVISSKNGIFSEEEIGDYNYDEFIAILRNKQLFCKK